MLVFLVLFCLVLSELGVFEAVILISGFCSIGTVKALQFQYPFLSYF